MTEKELTQSMANALSVPKVKAQQIKKAFLSSIIVILQKGESVVFKGFGTLKVVKTKKRMGHNPRTGEEMVIPSCLVVRFKMSPKLKGMLNETKKGKVKNKR